ncbi:MAG TPA: hypothetical protein VH572_04930 [Gaiella sp.]
MRARTLALLAGLGALALAARRRRRAQPPDRTAPVPSPARDVEAAEPASDLPEGWAVVEFDDPGDGRTG